MKIEKFKGIFPPVPTIVDKDGNLDTNGMSNLIEHIIKSGAHGMLILGSGGEFCHMTPKLRLEVAQFAVKHVAKRVPVIIGIASPSTQETINFGIHAQSIGADAVLIVNPFYALLNAQAMYQHYKQIARNIDIPIILYNFPLLTGQDIGIDVVVQLAKDVKNIIGIKDTIDNISHTRQIINEVHSFRKDFIIFSGFDEYLLDTLILGGHGAIPATFNFVPEYTLGIYNSFKNKEYDKTFEFQKKLAKIMPIYSIESPFFAVIKEAIKLRGIDISTEVLKPTLTLSSEKKNLVEKLLKDCQII